MKEIKGIQIGKEKLTLFLTADDKTLHPEKPKDSTRRLSELMNNFTKDAGYNSTYTNQYLFYTLIVNSEKEPGQQSKPLSTKYIKSQGINVTNGGKDVEKGGSLYVFRKTVKC